MIGRLPESLSVNGVEYAIKTDFRAILDIMEAFNDKELEIDEQAYICLFLLYEDFESIPKECMQEAFEQAKWFIDCGRQYEESEKAPSVMNWEKDESIIFPAVNNIARCEVRALKYLHWWTFIGYFMEIKEGVFTTVTSIRKKIAEHKRMDKWEMEYVSKNKNLLSLDGICMEENNDINELAELLNASKDKIEP